MCKQYGLSHSGTHWDTLGHTGTDTLGRMYVLLCMCKQYGLSHIGTHARALGHTGTHWDGCMYVCLYVCVNSTVYPTVGRARVRDTLGRVFVCVNSMVLWFGSVQPSIHPSIHPSAADDDGSGRQTPDALRYTIIGNDDDRFGDRARRRRRRRARSRVDSSFAHRFVSRRATAKKSNGRGVVKVVAPSGATRGHRDDASATDER